MKQLLIAFLLSGPFALQAQPILNLTPFSSNFDRPVDVTHAGDGRLFIVEQDGIIWVLDSLGNRLDTFLNIDPRVRSTGNEQGLLGLAFHPNYPQNGYFFVNYTRNGDGDTHISRFSRSTINPNEADPNSEQVLIVVDQPFNNHNAGCLKFGPDGYLYAALGDGGSGGDPQNNGQKKKTLLGKILRIDVDADAALYEIPADNPFANDTSYLPEIWSLGWRNPWRFSFDRLTGDMWVADVGQDTREEIDFEPAGVGGLNYGWRCYEGFVPFNTNGCGSADGFVPPVFDYDNASQGCSVTGGFVYRGNKYQELYGMYLFTDFCSGRWWGTRYDAANDTFITQQLANLADFEYASFGEDINGELYVTELSGGRILKITELCSTFQVSGTVTSGPVCAGATNGAIALDTLAGAQPITFAWSDGATVKDRNDLGPGQIGVTVSDNLGCTRVLNFDIQEQPTAPDPVLNTNRQVVCPGEMVVITAKNLWPPVELVWRLNGLPMDTVQTTDSVYTFNSNQTGAWSVSIFDSICAQVKTAEISIEQELPPNLALVTTPDGIALTDTVPGATYQWFRNNQMIPGATDWFLAPMNEGAYYVAVTTNNGCTYNSDEVVVLMSTNLPESVRSFRLSPNPTGDNMEFFLELEAPQRLLITLFDANGRVMFSQSKQGDSFKFPMDFRALAPGVYTLNVQMERGQWSRKVVKK